MSSEKSPVTLSVSLVRIKSLTRSFIGWPILKENFFVQKQKPEINFEILDKLN